MLLKTNPPVLSLCRAMVSGFLQTLVRVEHFSWGQCCVPGGLLVMCETPKLAQRGSGERTKLWLDMWLMAGSQLPVSQEPAVTC